ncbi:hypothetical protein [Klebsiella sp. HN106]|uniref:hypothetical protein n=1 Tax=Klebsiella sp. HN106 TaxID=3401058 RepID=UPI003EBE13A6
MRIIELIADVIKEKKSKSVPCDVLNSPPKLSKRIDEHRELMFEVERHTDLLVCKPWIKGWLLEMDNYLIQLFEAVYARPPRQSDHIRPLPFDAESSLRNPIPPPEWIQIEGVTDGSHDLSGAEWQNVYFAVPPNTATGVVDFIITQLRPLDGIHVSEYDPATGKGRFVNMGFDFTPGTYGLRLRLDAQ